MRNRSRAITFVVALAMSCAVSAGCGKSTSPVAGSGASGTAGTASALAGIAWDAAAAAQSTDSLAHAPFGPCPLLGLPHGIPSGCAYDASTQAFTCGPDVLPNGLTETHTYQFRDAADAPQSAYDSLATASIRLSSHLSGTTTSGPWSVVDDTRELVESALAGLETSRTWNGTLASSHADSVSLAGGARGVRTTQVNGVVTNVVVPEPWARDAWPLSGSIATHLVVGGDAGAFEQSSVLTFNGTNLATLVVGDSTYTVDLRRPPHGPAGGPPLPGGHGR